MKVKLLAIASLGICLVNCSPANKTSGNHNVIQIGPADIKTDSINYDEERYIISRAVNEKELNGKWIVLTMRRQEFISAEALEGVTLSFADSSFAGNAPCNSIAGDITLNGSQARFTNIIATKMACDKLELETAFLKLLENAVKIMGMEGNKLMLKDKAGHTIFECIKQP